MKKILLILGFLFCILTINAQPPAKIPFGNNPKAGKYFDNRGFKMYYEIYGTGEPLLFIHGNGGSIDNFRNQIPYFSKDYQVILADSRSQGKSLDASDSLSYEMMSDDLNALLDHLHIKSCNVIGWSDGGINGLLLTIRHPNKVKKLAITGANLVPDESAVDPFIYKWAKSLNDSINKLPVTPETKIDKKLLNLLSYEPHISTKDLGKIQIPVLVIGGDHDVIKTEHTMLIAESIPKSYLWILPNSGHSTPIVYKDLFNETVDHFLKNPYREIEGLDRLR